MTYNFFPADSFTSHIAFCDFLEYPSLWHLEIISPNAALLGHFDNHVVLRRLGTTHLPLLLAVFAGNQRKVHD